VHHVCEHRIADSELGNSWVHVYRGVKGSPPKNQSERQSEIFISENEHDLIHFEKLRRLPAEAARTHKWQHISRSCGAAGIMAHSDASNVSLSHLKSG